MVFEIRINFKFYYYPCERVRGIGPLYSVWKTDVLPLYYTRKLKKFLIAID